MSLDRSEETQTLSEEERRRAARFIYERHRRRFIAAHAALRAILAAYTKRAPERITLEISEYGKPFLPERELEFNLSHSHERAVLAVSERSVGIDIEHVRSVSDADQIAERFFSQEEVEELRKIPLSERVEGFFRCWTRKEAFIKGIGEGLSFPLHSFGVSLQRDEPLLLRVDGDPDAERRWRLANVTVAADYVGAIAVEGGFDRLVVREWPGEA